jgi:tRNA pseudouridine55 synthase
MSERPVDIHELEIESFDGRDAVIRVRCSSGTYIRSLARDIALAAGSRARLEGLARLEVGPFSLRDAVPAEELDPLRDLRPLDTGLAASLGLEPFRLREEAVRRFSSGASIEEADMESLLGPACPGAKCRFRAVFSAIGAFLGLMEGRDASLRYRFVLGTDR